jgi:hypothetical protein
MQAAPVENEQERGENRERISGRSSVENTGD